MSLFNQIYTLLRHTESVFLTELCCKQMLCRNRRLRDAESKLWPVTDKLGAQRTQKQMMELTWLDGLVVGELIAGFSGIS